MKKRRQEKLLELISAFEIDTQDELIDRLRDHGFEVTQATVSRDIRELNISKMTTGKGTYRYVLSKQNEDHGQSMRFGSTIIGSIVSVDSALNIVVLKTMPGLASAACSTLDNMSISYMVGSLAGDDTAFLVMKDTESAAAFCEEIQEML